MNKIIISLALGLVSNFAMAQSQAISCRDVTNEPDNGYLVSVSADHQWAVVSKQSISGPHSASKLKCSTPATPSLPDGAEGSDSSDAQNPGTADGVKTLLSCSERVIADGGYALEIVEGGVAGFLRATLSEVSLLGSKSVANLICSVEE